MLPPLRAVSPNLGISSAEHGSQFSVASKVLLSPLCSMFSNTWVNEPLMIEGISAVSHMWPPPYPARPSPFSLMCTVVVTFCWTVRFNVHAVRAPWWCLFIKEGVVLVRRVRVVFCFVESLCYFYRFFNEYRHFDRRRVCFDVGITVRDATQPTQAA